ncbi:helix-turn-helix domain-containing protein [Microbacterium sp. NPDC091313]
MRSALADFLRARRAQVRPEDAGLPADPGRRVPGLRREEVAQLADISPEYYLRIEQGRHRAPSPQVLDALARALLLDQDGAYYLRRLVRLDSGPGVLGTPDPRVAASVQRTVDAMGDCAAVVLTPVGDVVVANDRLVAVIGEGLVRTGNLVLAVFSQSFRSRAAEWESVAESVVANLRFRADPGDPHLREIVGLLSLRDADFRRIWAQQSARSWNCGSISFVLDDGSGASVGFQNFEVPGSPGWVMSVLRIDGSPVSARPEEEAERRVPAGVR